MTARPCSQCRQVDVDRPCGICQPCIARMSAESRVAQGLTPKLSDPAQIDEVARLFTSNPKSVAA